jgi:hypothetical protein
MVRTDEGIQKHRAEFVRTLISYEAAPVRVLSKEFIPTSRKEDLLLGARKRCKHTKVLIRPGIVGNQDIEHPYLLLKSISVTLVLGSHEPIPSVCCTITGTGPDPGHLA